MPKHCYCGKRKAYKQCCGLFIDGDQVARTPEQLMRSRYRAYAQGGQGQYLFDTWYPATRLKLSPALLDQKDSEWLGLTVLDRGQQDDEGFVEFSARFRDQIGQEQLLHEKSVFQRLNGHWLYVGGDVEIESND